MFFLAGLSNGQKPVAPVEDEAEANSHIGSMRPTVY